MMTPASWIPPRRPGRDARAAPAVLAVVVGGVPTAGLSLFLARSGESSLGALGQAGLLYALIALGVLIGAGRRTPRDRFGLANWITLARAALVCGLAGPIGAGLPETSGWLLASLGLAAFALDGLDGWVARRTGTSSDFGARFDREVDALFVLVLALLVVDVRRAGCWMLFAGLLRYGFVAGRVLWPWLAAELPPSRRRKAIFCVQVSLLLACLLPVAGPALVAVLAATALAAVSLSFAIDILWLRRIAGTGVSRCKGPDSG